MKMRDSELPLAERIDAALRRVTNGEGTMRIPVEATETDIVLADCRMALDYYRSAVEQRAPKWVPARVMLPVPVRGDYPIGHTTLAEAGDHDCDSNRWGAVSVIARDGKPLGLRLDEFEPVAWRENVTANAKVSGAGTASAGLPGYAPAHDGERK